MPGRRKLVATARYLEVGKLLVRLESGRRWRWLTARSAVKRVELLVCLESGSCTLIIHSEVLVGTSFGIEVEVNAAMSDEVAGGFIRHDWHTLSSTVSNGK